MNLFFGYLETSEYAGGIENIYRITLGQTTRVELAPFQYREGSSRGSDPERIEEGTNYMARSSSYIC